MKIKSEEELKSIKSKLLNLEVKIGRRIAPGTMKKGEYSKAFFYFFTLEGGNGPQLRLRIYPFRSYCGGVILSMDTLEVLGLLYEDSLDEKDLKEILSYSVRYAILDYAVFYPHISQYFYVNNVDSQEEIGAILSTKMFHKFGGEIRNRNSGNDCIMFVSEFKNAVRESFYSLNYEFYINE